MNSAINRTVCTLGFVLSLLPLCAVAQETAPTAPAPQPALTAPTPAPAPAATAAPTVAAPTEEEGWINVQAPDEAASLSEKEEEKAVTIDPPEKGEMTNEQILALLRGSTQRPLTVADLAAINDMLKRLEYQVQVEKKMSEMKLGIITPASMGRDTPAGMGNMGGAVPGISPSRVNNDSSGRSVAERYAIMRVFGSKGNYTATVVGTGSDGISRQVQVRSGDQLDGAQVVAIGVNGVKVADGSGVSNLAFVSPMSINGVAVTANPLR